MPTPLVSSLTAFKEAIASGGSIAFDKNGNWYKRWAITALFRWIFAFKKQDDIALAKNYSRYLNHLSVPSSKIRSGFQAAEASLQQIEETTTAIYDRLKPYLHQEKCAQENIKTQKDRAKYDLVYASREGKPHLQKKVSKAKSTLKTLRKEARAQAVWRDIRRAVIADKYQKKSQADIHKGTTTPPEKQTAVLNLLEKKVSSWKKKQYPKLSTILSDYEKAAIAKISHYPELVEEFKKKELGKDACLRHELFAFVFRNTLDACEDAVDIFVQTPKVQRRLTRSYLDAEIRRIANNGLRFIEKEGQKDVELLVNGEFISILKDPNREITNKGKTETLKNLFAMFKNRNKQMPTWQFMKKGLVYTNTPMPLFDETKKDWYNDLEEYQTYTRKEVEARLKKNGVNNIDSSMHTFFFAKASRRSKNLHPGSNHAWLEVLLPQEDGTFSSHTFGFFAEFFPDPDSTSEEFFFTFKSHAAIIASPDCNELNYSREKTEMPIPLTKQEFDYLMNDILLSDLIKVRNKELDFQGQGGGNCAGWVQDVLDRLYAKFSPKNPAPKLFEIYNNDMDIPNPLRVFTKVPKSPVLEAIQRRARIVFARIMRTVYTTFFDNTQENGIEKGGKKPRKPMTANTLWQENKITLPAQLFRVKEKIQNLLRAQQETTVV